MITRAQAALARTPPVTVTLRRLLYHPEAIALSVSPASALAPILAAAHAATRGVPGADAAEDDREEEWAPHLTLCYSTTEQPAAPVIAALGKTLSAREVTIREMSLVVQQGPEPLWNWRIAAEGFPAGPAQRRARLLRVTAAHGGGAHVAAVLAAAGFSAVVY
jgi:2'-5' RNA ligase